jgi:hypothetical protein
MPKRLRAVTLAVAAALMLTATAAAGPRTKIKECGCSIETPGKWFVVEYYQDADGLEHLVTASPFEQPGVQPVPGVQFLRQKLEPGIEVSAEEFLQAVGAEFKDMPVTGPVAASMGKVPGAKMDVVFTHEGNSVHQRYYAAVRPDGVYVVVLSWLDAGDLPKLEESPKSVRF